MPYPLQILAVPVLLLFWIRQVHLVIAAAIHVAGHTLAARWLGLPVEIRLGWGLPMFDGRVGALPGLWTKTEPSELSALPPGRLAAFLAAGSIANLVAAFVLPAVLFTLIGLHGFQTSGEATVASACVRVEGGSAARAGIETGNCLTEIDGRPVKSWTDLQGALVDERHEVVVVSPSGTEVRTLERGADGWGLGPLDRVVGRALPGGAYAEAGGQAGDHLLTCDGEPLESWDHLLAKVATQRPLALVVDRGGEEIALTVTPRALNGVSSPVIGVAAMPGATYRPLEDVVLGPVEAVGHGVSETADIWARTLSTLGRLFWKSSPNRTLEGPIALVHVDVDTGWLPYLQLLAMLLVGTNIGMALFNLLPLAWSDAWTGLDELAWRTRERRFPASVGVVLLIAFMLLITAMDVSRFVSRL